MKEESQGAIVIYRTKDGKAAMEVNLSGETLWLNQGQMSILFDRDRSVITKHLSNIFKSGELDKKSNVQKMHIAGSDKPETSASLLSCSSGFWMPAEFFMPVMAGSG